MNRIVVALIFAFFVSYLVEGQSLYVPGGTGGIGSSSNSKIGIGSNQPDETLSIRSNTYSKVGNTMEFPLAINRVNTDVQSLFLGSDNSYNPIIAANNAGLIFGRYYGGNDSFTEYFRMSHNGNIGIGITNPNYKVTVDGTISAKEVKVSATPNADFVFQADFRLRPLSEVEYFILQNKHLPDIPSAEEFKENGVGLGEMDNMLLQKVEELMLYVIAQQKELDRLRTENEDQAERLSKLENP